MHMEVGQVLGGFISCVLFVFIRRQFHSEIGQRVRNASVETQLRIRYFCWHVLINSKDSIYLL